jgi:uncharacterized protein YjdB
MTQETYRDIVISVDVLLVVGFSVAIWLLLEIRKFMTTAGQALTDLQNVVAELVTDVQNAVTAIQGLINDISSLNGLNPTAVEAIVSQAKTTLGTLEASIANAQNVLNPPPPTLSVSVSPATATIAVGATQQFTASVSGTTNQVVTWSASAGSIDQTGLFTAPATAGSATITATANQDGKTTGSASVSFA